MSKSPEDFTGRRVGLLTVLAAAGTLPRRNGVIGNRLWRCRCDCGAETSVTASNLRHQKTVSCGCHRKRIHSNVIGRRAS